MLRSLALVVFLLVSIQFSGGQTTDVTEAPSLESLIREALSNNPAIASSRYRENASEQRISQMRSWMPPTLRYEYNRLPIGAMEMIDFATMHTYSISQMIPFPGKVSARVDMERSNHEMFSFERSDAEVQLSAKVKQLYYGLWMNQKMLEVNSDLQLLLENFVTSAERMYEVDMAGLEAVLTAQTTLSKLRTEQRVLTNEYNKMLAMFNQFLGRYPDEHLGSITTLPAEDIQLDFSDLERRLLERRPDIQAMRSGIEMKRAEIRSARREYYPDLMVDLMYMQMPGNMQDQFGAMLSIQIPLAPWSSNMVTKKVSEAQNEQRSREKALENMRTMARAEIRQAVLDLETQRDVIHLYRDDVLPQAEQTAESVLGAFQAGKLEYLMVLDSFRMLEMFRMEYYQAQAEYHKAVAELERQAGIIY